MFATDMNLVTTVIGFGMSIGFIVFLCTRIICRRLRGVEPGDISDIDSRIIDIEQRERRNNTGLEPVLVASIPSVVFDREASNTAEDAQCSICLVEYQEGDILRVMPKCSHNFHLCCIDVWLKKQPTCPVCRFPLHNTLGVANSTEQTSYTGVNRIPESPQLDIQRS